MLPSDWRKVAAPQGVTGTVVVEASAWVEDNQWILDLAKSDKSLLGLVGHLEPSAKDFATNLERFHKNKLFLGIRLNGLAIAECLGNPVQFSNLQRLAGAGMMLDAIGQPEMLIDLVKLSENIPALRIVIDHAPYNPPRMIKELAAMPQVYAKVSGGMPSTDALDELWGIFGEDRLIYGSNWPVSDKVAPYGEIFGNVKKYFSQKGPAAEEKYFWKNSQTAYRWRTR